MAGPWDDILDGMAGSEETEPQADDQQMSEAEIRLSKAQPPYPIEITNLSDDLMDTVGGPEDSEDSFDQQMSEAERRLSKALLYKQWIGGKLFEGDSSDLTREVETEIGDFVKERLSILLGCEVPKAQPIQPTVETQFSPLEAKFLKLFVSHSLEKKPKLKEALERESTEIPSVPKPAPVRPTIKPRQQPEATKPSIQPKSNSIKVQARPVQKSSVKKEDVLPQDGETVVEGSNRFKVKWSPMSPDEYGEKVEKLLLDLPINKHIKLPSPGKGAGIQVYKATNEDFFKILRLNITPQIQSNKGVPMPADNASMAAVTAMQAGAALANMSKGVKSIAETVEKMAQQ